jgi:hypothetical protein
MSDIKESFYNKLDEMRSETLKSYIKKAGESKAAHSRAYDSGDGSKDPIQNMRYMSHHFRKTKNREKGIERATKKLEE